jgi:LDH2 family malate/lactate/ureidoglycolate dehydrogenase
MKISIEKLKNGLKNIFLDKDFSVEDTERILDYLMWAEMSGNKTQGIIKMSGTDPIQNIKPQHEIKVERETKVSKLINAGVNPAPIASQFATEEVIKKAKETGLAIVSVHNTFSSNGAQAFYAEKIAKNDLVGIVVSRSPGAVAPFNSIDSLFGTNPIGFSFPTNEEPFVFDMATSAMTFYGLILAKAKNDKLPEGIAIDKDGNLTVEPEEAIEGAILPFDKSYKGSCLGMMVELLAGPLANSAYCDYKTFKEEWGSTFIAIDPNILVDIKDFKDNASKMIEMIRNSRTKNNEKIRLPGEGAKTRYHNSLESGVVDIEENILKELNLA